MKNINVWIDDDAVAILFEYQKAHKISNRSEALTQFIKEASRHGKP